MENFRNPMYAAEPYEESQERESASITLPDALAAFYQDMERKEMVERKLSKRKSNSGTSIWSRKSIKRSATAPPVQPPPAQKPHPPRPSDDATNKGRNTGEEERDLNIEEEQNEESDSFHQMNSPRSIIPDLMKELPAWYNKDIWTSVPLPSNRVRYNIHNPVGPRWYKNHHLVPPSLTKPAARPPSVFSPSFPPITSSTTPEHAEDVPCIPGPSRTPSNSPLPTPSSSQTRVADANGKPRSRKTSQTAHDNVDLLDVTDPWGTNWHHQSPYDIGLGNGPISIDAQDALHARSRRSSMTTPNRRKSVIPSPLSQSTSAVHLNPRPDIIVHMPRKLSKRRTVAPDSTLSGSIQDSGRNAVSLPATPAEPIPHTPQTPTTTPESQNNISTTHLKGLSISSSQVNTSKKEKRGSILGRLVKKFSILRKPNIDPGNVIGREDGWQHINVNDTNGALRHGNTLDDQSSRWKLHPDVAKRIPPPPIDDPSSRKSEEIVKENDRSSSISLEAPFSIGRLTVANPDSPGSGDTTPIPREVPLPLDKSEHSDREVGTDSQPPSTLQQAPLSTETHTPVIPEKVSPASTVTTSERNNHDTSTTSSSISRPRSTESQYPVPPEKLKTPSIYPAPSVASYTSRNPGWEKQLPDLSTGNQNAHRPQPARSSQKFAPSTELHIHHASDKPQPVPPPEEARPVSLSPSVPFPITDSEDRAHSFTSYDYSPLSAASMLVNPPTPYAPDLSISLTPEPPLPALPPPPEKPAPTDLPSTGQTSRQTETFKLVRSPSGNVYTTSETIVAAGQQWEVVEASENKNKGKLSKPKDKVSKDRESSSRREQKKEGRAKTDQPEMATDYRHRARSQRNRKSQSGDISTSASKPSTQIPKSEIGHDGTVPLITGGRQIIGKSSRKRNEDKDRKSEWKEAEEHVPAPDTNKPQPAPPPPTSSRPMERHPSLSARPTSQLPLAAEMNALRAKEAWDMERLWKGRSMHGHESNGYMTIPSHPNSPIAGEADELHSQSATHGSSHTAFVVQTPFQSQRSIYHSMPTAPPPIIYSSPPPTTSMPKPLTFPHDHSDRRSHTFSARSLLSNPLPEPPRESTYEPTPLPPSNNGRSSDYWVKSAGVATSH